MIDLGELVLAEPDRRVRGRLNPTRVAIVTGVIFFFAGLVKFAFHGWELHAFRSFGLPWPSALEIFAGVVEVIGGVLLVARRAVVPVAIVLAVTMVVAIISSGIGHGDVIPSLTLAPALLLALLYLLARGLAGDFPHEHPVRSTMGSEGIHGGTSQQPSPGHGREDLQSPGESQHRMAPGAVAARGGRDRD